MKPDTFYRSAILFEGGLAVVAILTAIPFGLNLWTGAVLDLSALLWIVGATAASVVVYLVLKWLPFEALKEIDRYVKQFYRDYLKSLAVWQLAVIALLAGFGEELLFRGLFQTGLIQAAGYFGFSGLPVSATVIVCASILFGLAHALSKMYFFLAFLISICFGVILLATGNILIPIFVHAFYDLFVFLYIGHELSKEN